MKHNRKYLWWIVFVILFLAGCGEADSGKPDTPPINRDGGIADEKHVPDGVVLDGRVLDGTQEANSPLPISRGWVENDNGKGGKLVNVKWTWLNPLPQGNPLLDIWGDPVSKKMWAVGHNGTIMHYDTDTWHEVNSGTTQDLHGVWGCSEDDVYAVGIGGTILHFDGQKWESIQSGTTQHLYGVFCDTPSNIANGTKQIYAVGGYRTFLKSDGKNWQSLSWVDAPDMPEHHEEYFVNLYSVWGDGTGNVYAVGEYETFIRYDGNQFSTAPDDTGKFNFESQLIDIWGASPKHLFILYNLSFRSRLWFSDAQQTVREKEFDGESLYSLWGITSGEGSMAIVGDTGKLRYLYYDEQKKESAWKVDLPPVDQKPAPQDLYGVWGFGEGDQHRYWMVGDKGTLLTFDGKQLTALSKGPLHYLNGISGEKNEPFFAVGDKGTLLQKKPNGWQVVQSGVSQKLNHIWGNDSGQYIAVGDEGQIVHNDGSGTWKSMTSGTTQGLKRVWGFDANNLITVGERGTILRYRKSQWKPMTSGVNVTLHSIWGTDEKNIFAVGDYNTIIYYDGKDWHKQLSNGLYRLKAVWGTEINNVYAVGGNVVLHYNGTEWKTVVAGFKCELVDIKGSGPNHIFALSACGDALYFNGDKWIVLSGKTYQKTKSLWLSNKGEAFISGEGGTILSLEVSKN